MCSFLHQPQQILYPHILCSNTKKNFIHSYTVPVVIIYEVKILFAQRPLGILPPVAKTNCERKIMHKI